MHRNTWRYILLFALLLGSFLLNLGLGSAKIPLAETIAILTGGVPELASWEYIITEYRLPKAFTAMLTGGGLALSGLLMQTFFRNPLAGPFVLGISSGASLGAALLIFGSGFLLPASLAFAPTNAALAIASSLGSLAVLLLVLSVSYRVKDAMALLIIGLMFGSITAAIVTVLSSLSQAEALQQYIFWSYGSIGNLGWNNLGILGLLFVLGVGLAVGCLKGLNALLLGPEYAGSLGINMPRLRLQIILATGILAGGITAFAGPIAFVGLAVPHLTRLAFKSSDHRVLVPGVLLTGAILMLFCDTVAQLPRTAYVLPINAITSVLGAPVVIWLLLRRKTMMF